jgi:hypothetical protein
MTFAVLFSGWNSCQAFPEIPVLTDSTRQRPRILKVDAAPPRVRLNHSQQGVPTQYSTELSTLRLTRYFSNRTVQDVANTVV